MNKKKLDGKIKTIEFETKKYKNINGKRITISDKTKTVYVPKVDINGRIGRIVFRPTGLVKSGIEIWKPKR